MNLNTSSFQEGIKDKRYLDTNASKQEIRFQNIEFHPTSFCDSSGRVFWWHGELFRGIRQEQAQFYNRLFEQGIVQRLIEDEYLIDTERTNLCLSEYPLVLKHRIIPFVTYANEWCSEMLLDAGLFIADMALDLARDNLIIDANTWDMLFDGTQPVYVDFCSLQSISPDNQSMINFFRDEFRSYFIFPLQLIGQGYDNLARLLLQNYEHEPVHSEFAALLGHRIYNYSPHKRRESPFYSLHHRFFGALQRLTWKCKKLTMSVFPITPLQNIKDNTLFIYQLRRELEQIKLPGRLLKHAANSEDQSKRPYAEDSLIKQAVVRKIILERNPTTVLVAGCKRGDYARLAATLGSTVVAIDDDDSQITYCYQQAKKSQLSILPLVVDLANPAPGSGPCNETITPALKRLRCELVLAISLVHLLFMKQGMTFDHIVRTFYTLSEKYLLVEFPLPQTPEVRMLRSANKASYSLDHFINSLKSKFRSVRTLSQKLDTSVFLFCEK